MEEKIYDRQVTKQSLSYRVVDHQQIERHFTLFELNELYTFEPALLDDPNSKKSKRPTSALPKVTSQSYLPPPPETEQFETLSINLRVVLRTVSWPSCY